MTYQYKFFDIDSDQFRSNQVWINRKNNNIMVSISSIQRQGKSKIIAGITYAYLGDNSTCRDHLFDFLSKFMHVSELD